MVIPSYLMLLGTKILNNFIQGIWKYSYLKKKDISTRIDIFFGENQVAYSLPKYAIPGKKHDTSIITI